MTATIGEAAASEPQVFTSTTHVLTTVARYEELLAFERFRDHIGCWPTCAVYEKDTMAECDCGFELINHLNGETGWGARWPVNDEARALGARLHELMRAEGFGFEGWETKRTPRHEAKRDEVRKMTTRMKQIVREHQGQWVQYVETEPVTPPTGRSTSSEETR